MREGIFQRLVAPLIFILGLSATIAYEAISNDTALDHPGKQFQASLLETAD